MNSQEKAVEIALRVLDRLPLRPGMRECDLAAWMRKELKKEGAKKESFRIIVASGRRTNLIHGFASTKRIKENELVMVDFGALYKGMRSDLTRMFFLGKPTKFQLKVYRLLIKAQKAALKKVKAGNVCSEVDLAARQVLARAGLGRFFRHTVGHGIGKQVHQAPKLSRKNRNRLKAGQVITIEPGVYLGQWGMRVEDMVRVTNRGFQMLTGGHS